jgi:hypothetical protein
MFKGEILPADQLQAGKWSIVMPPEVEVLYVMKLRFAGVPIKQSQEAFHAPRVDAKNAPSISDNAGLSVAAQQKQEFNPRR